jgi:hypothetical protein
MIAFGTVLSDGFKTVFILKTVDMCRVTGYIQA